ncbi:cell adhesion molecule CEACAM5-like [Paroedura picta]|uniref:cell adhesion molecule CEACAM5-like n=1 Tax=Paroedura picta TaxID=143630 RepID=UPI004056B755
MKNLLTPTHWGIPSRKPWLRPRQAPAGLLLTCGAAPRFVRTAPALQSSPLCPAPGRRRRHSPPRLPRGDLSLGEKARSRGRLPGSASPASPARRGRPPPPQPGPARGRRCRRLVGAPGAGGLRGRAQRRKVPGRQARRPPERSRGMGTQAAGPGSPPRGWLARRLLAAAVLSCCFLLTQAQDIPVTVNPPKPVEGQEVTLTPGGSPNIFSCNWFRGEDLPPNRIFVYLPSSEQENGPGYTGRETGGSNCSLHIRSLTLNDTGKYTVLKTASTGLSEKGSVQIQVLVGGASLRHHAPAYSLLENSAEDWPPALCYPVTGGTWGIKTYSSSVPNPFFVPIKPLIPNGRILFLPLTGFLTKPSVSAFPTPFPIESMGSVTLTCETTFEEVLFSWFYDGEPLNGSSRIQISGDNRTVVINDAIRSDTGEYQCQVTNPISASRSDSLYVAVICEYHCLTLFGLAGHGSCLLPCPVAVSYPIYTSHELCVSAPDGPDTPVIQPTEGFYHQHSEIRLFCYADAFPDPHYIWSVNGKERNTTSELLIPDATPEDSGTYVCQAWNVLSHHKDNATLGIAVADEVSNVTIVGPSTAIEYYIVQLSCTSQGSLVSYYWLKGSQLVEPGDRVILSDKNMTLTLNSSNRDDTSSYVCQGVNDFSSQYSEPHWLEIFYGPDSPIIDPQESVYNEGSTLNLSCFADSNPTANYSWWYNNQLLENQTDSRLLIQDLSRSSAGSYTCNATNDDTGDFSTSSLEVTVLEPVSNVIITSHPDKPVENDLIVLNCSSAGSNVSYSWSKGDQKLASGGHIFLGYNSLTFNPIRRNDTGNYTCSGQNSFSNSSATYLLDVFYGPDEPVISPPRHDYAEGSPLTLSCRADSHPSAQYTWSFNNTELPKMNSQLSILSLSFDQAGNYTCNASNPETSFSSSTSWEIKVLEKLIPPTLQPAEFIAHEHMNITLTCTTSESANVYVSWFKDGQPIPAKLILSERNRTLTIPDFSQADEGIYICQAQNPANSAQSNPSKITLDSSSGPGLSPGQIAGIVIGCLLGVVLISAVLYFVLKSTTLGRMEQHSSNGNIPSAPGHNQGVTDTKPTAGEEDIQYTTLAFNTYSPPQPKPGATIPLESGTIYSVIKNK